MSKAPSEPTALISAHRWGPHPRSAQTKPEPLRDRGGFGIDPFDLDGAVLTILATSFPVIPRLSGFHGNSHLPFAPPFLLWSTCRPRSTYLTLLNAGEGTAGVDLTGGSILSC